MATLVGPDAAEETYRLRSLIFEISFVIAEAVFTAVFCQDACQKAFSVYLRLSHIRLVAVSS